MKILSLNIYGARVHDPLIETLRDQAQTVDVFCFQEVYHVTHPDLETASFPHPNLFSELKNLLPEFQAYFTSGETTQTKEEKRAAQEGLALFVRQGIEVKDVQPILTFAEAYGPNSKHESIVERFSQHVRLSVNKRGFSLFNVHGATFPGDKLDTPERLWQSEALIQAAQSVDEPSIILGDFNLLPQTKSVRSFQEAGLINLVEREEIKTTRGTLCKQLHPEFSRPPYTIQEYADYTFTSPSLTVRSFQVPDLPISDHLPMIMEIDLPN